MRRSSLCLCFRIQMSSQHSQISALRSSFSRALGIIQDLLGAQNPTLADIKLEVDASLLASQVR